MPAYTGAGSLTISFSAVGSGAIPGGLDLDVVQADILAEAQSVLAEFQVVSGGIPDATNIAYSNGVLIPYIVLQFSDMYPRAGGGSFGGARWAGYYSYVNIFSVAPTDDIARGVISKARNKLLGYVATNASELRVAPGGGTFAISRGKDLPDVFTALTSLVYETNVSRVSLSQYDA